MENKFGKLSLLFAIIAWILLFLGGPTWGVYGPMTMIFLVLSILIAIVALIKKENNIYPIFSIVIALAPIIIFYAWFMIFPMNF